MYIYVIYLRVGINIGILAGKRHWSLVRSCDISVSFLTRFYCYYLFDVS